MSYLVYMPKHNSSASRRRPDVPFGGEYIWVETRESSFWRRKRGTLKPATLNDSFKKNVELAKLTSPAAKRILGKLHPFTRGLYPGRINLRISNLLRSELKKFETINFSTFRNFEFQEKYTLHRLLPGLQVQQSNDLLKVEITVTQLSFPFKNQLISDCYFDLILLQGNPMNENELDIDSNTSKLIPILNTESNLTMSIPLPELKTPWMVLLKINCLEGNELAVHHRHYAMGVIAVNS